MSRPKDRPTAALLLPLAYMGGIYLLSSIEGGMELDAPFAGLLFVWTPPAVQNLLHIPLFGGLAWLWRWALEGRADVPARLNAGAFLLTAGYGILDEWHQMMVPGRFPSLTDVLLDAVGALAALWLYARWRRTPLWGAA